MNYKIGINISVLFTEAVMMDENGRIVVSRVPSVSGHYEANILNSIEDLSKQIGTDRKSLLNNLSVVIFAADVGSDVIRMRSGPKMGIIATKGHRDVIQLRRVRKENMWDWRASCPPPLVPRHLRVEVDERISSSGEILRPLDEQSVHKAVAYLKKMGVTTIVVTLIFSFINPVHEDRVGEIIKADYPEAKVILSHEILPVPGEYERFTTAVIDAYVGAATEKCVDSVCKLLQQEGYKGKVFLMQNNGGYAGAQTIIQKPSILIGGNTAPIPFAGFLAGRLHDVKNLVSLSITDISCDVGLIANDSFSLKNESLVCDQLLSLPVVDTENIGSGGNSLVWFDIGNSIHVGPKSVPLDIGPACYSQGGQDPTLIDATLVLGYLNPDNFSSRWKRLDKNLAFEAIEKKVARRLGQDVSRSAAVIYRVSNSLIASGVLHYLAKRGYSPQDFVLCAGGIVAPTCVLLIANEIGANRVIIPKYAAAYIAAGILVTNIRHNITRYYRSLITNLSVSVVEKIFKEMEDEGRNLLSLDGVTGEQCTLQRTAYMRYYGQFREIEIPLPEQPITENVVTQAAAKFHQRHRELFGSYHETHPIEVIKLGVMASAIIDQLPLAKIDRDPLGVSEALKAMRDAFFEELGGYIPTPVYDACKLSSGNTIEGPALVEDAFMTVVVPPKFRLLVDDWGNYVTFCTAKE